VVGRLVSGGRPAMGLLASQQRRAAQPAGTGGHAARLAMMAAAALLMLALWRQAARLPRGAPLEEDGEEALGGPDADPWRSLSESMDASVAEDLARLDSELEELRRRRAEDEAPDRLAEHPGQAADGGDGPDALPVVPRVTGVGDVRASWEHIINYAIDHMGHCSSSCEACASSLGHEMVKADSLLLRGRQPTVLGELKTEADMREEVESVQKDIGQCAARLEADMATRHWQQQHRARLRSAENQYKREMSEVERREKQAVEYELLRQKLEDTVEQEEEAQQHLHDVANPIWMPIDKWTEQAEGLCTQKVMLVMETKFPPEELHSKPALKAKQELFKKCMADAKTSRAKLRADAELLQKDLRHQKRASLAPSIKARHKRHDQMLKYAGVEVDALEELKDIREEALKVSLHRSPDASGGRHQVGSGARLAGAAVSR